VLTEIPIKENLQDSSNKAKALEKIFFLNNEIYRVFSQKLDFNSNKNYYDFYYFIESKKLNLKFDLNEIPIKLTKNCIFTSKEDAPNYLKIIKALPLKKNSIDSTKIKELKVDIYDNVEIDEYQNINVTRGHEGGGYGEVIKYSSSFNEVLTKKTFSDNNGEGRLFNSRNKNLNVFLNYYENKFNLNSYEPLGREKLIHSKQLNLGENCTATSMLVEGTNIIILITDNIGKQSLLTLDKTFNVIAFLDLPVYATWERLISFENEIFFSSPDLEIFSYNIKDRKIKWKKSDNYQKSLITKKNNIYEFEGGRLYSFKNKYLIFIKGVYREGGSLKEHEINDCSLILINSKSGETLQKIKLGDFKGDINISKSSTQLVLYDKKRIKLFKIKSDD